MKRDELLKRECNVGIELLLKDKIMRMKSLPNISTDKKELLTIEKSIVQTSTPQIDVGIKPFYANAYLLWKRYESLIKISLKQRERNPT